MRAAVLTEFGKPLKIEEREMPKAGKGEILVKVAAIGICGTDLKIWHGKKDDTPLPLIMGHEIAGTIETVGEGVTSLVSGMRGVVHFYCSCHECELCRDNRETLCQNMNGRLGFSRDGGMREYITVSAENFIPVPDNVNLEEVCIVADAISTVYRGLTRAGIKKGENVLVVGMGGLGVHAVQMAKALGANVVGVDVDDAKLEFARKYGCERSVNTKGKNADEIINEINKFGIKGIDIVLETVSRTETLEVDLKLLNPSGRIVILGYGAPSVQLTPYSFVKGEVTILGSRASSREDTKHALDLIAQGLIKPAISNYYRLEDVNKALAALEEGKVLGRQVLLVDDEYKKEIRRC